MKMVKFFIVLITAVLFSNARAQGPMPKCFAEAVKIAQFRASTQNRENWDYINAKVQFENNLEIDWVIDLENFSNSQVKSFRADLTKLDCKLKMPCCSPCNPNCTVYPSCSIHPGSCH
ncbi:MAG: hypothetical protein ACXVCY_17215 [Pseudobdellovibrionaceae bacterium]